MHGETVKFRKQVTIAGLIVVDMKIMILWNVKSCNFLAAYKHFRGSGSLHFERQRNLLPKIWKLPTKKQCFKSHKTLSPSDGFSCCSSRKL